MESGPSLFQTYALSCKLQAGTKSGNNLPPLDESSPIVMLKLHRNGAPQSNPSAKDVAWYDLPKERDSGIRLIRQLADNKTFYDVCGGKDVFDYLLTELVDNVYQHSGFSNACVIARRVYESRSVELCIFDDGLTIPGVIRKSGKDLNSVASLQAALQGYSTKSPERGYGLRTSVRLTCQGLKGQILIVSGSAAYWSSQNQSEEYGLQPPLALDGTLVALRLPFTTNVDDFYDYIS